MCFAANANANAITSPNANAIVNANVTKKASTKENVHANRKVDV
jgi:hypothetical protein